MLQFCNERWLCALDRERDKQEKSKTDIDRERSTLAWFDIIGLEMSNSNTKHC